MKFSVAEINLILAIENALHERQQEEQERLQRVSQARQSFTRGR
jgi:hypothetical protein|tara:strand:+ start:3689 stop:3820 length:132 start_codon:yes stop_codon:yes gene_type:complete